MATVIEKPAVKMKKRNIPRTAIRSRVRLGALAIAISGILFVLYPAIRPFSEKVTLQGAEAFASPQWILAHVRGKR